MSMIQEADSKKKFFWRTAEDLKRTAFSAAVVFLVFSHRPRTVGL